MKVGQQNWKRLCDGGYIAIPEGSYWLHDLHIKRLVHCYYENAPLLWPEFIFMSTN